MNLYKNNTHGELQTKAVECNVETIALQLYFMNREGSTFDDIVTSQITFVQYISVCAIVLILYKSFFCLYLWLNRKSSEILPSRLVYG